MSLNNFSNDFKATNFDNLGTSSVTMTGNSGACNFDSGYPAVAGVVTYFTILCSNIIPQTQVVVSLVCADSPLFLCPMQKSTGQVIIGVFNPQGFDTTSTITFDIKLW